MAVTLTRVCGHTFISDRLTQESVVLDLGMNEGEFAKWIVSNTAATCFGVEPVPSLFSRLPRHPRIHAKQVAIGGKAGSADLHIYRRHCASLMPGAVAADAVEVLSVRTMTLSELMTEFQIQRVDLMKVDIEGAELDVFETIRPATLANLAQICIEFHDFLDAAMLPRIKRAIRLLREHDFWVQKFSWSDHSDILAINQAVVSLSPADRMAVRTNRFVSMAKRRVGRIH